MNWKVGSLMHSTGVGPGRTTLKASPGDSAAGLLVVETRTIENSSLKKGGKLGKEK